MTNFLNEAKKIVREKGIKVKTTKIPNFRVGGKATYIMVFSSTNSASSAADTLRKEGFQVYNKVKNSFWINP